MIKNLLCNGLVYMCETGEETEWQKILEKVNSAIQNNLSVDGWLCYVA